MELCLAPHGVCTASDSLEITFCNNNVSTFQAILFNLLAKLHEVKVRERRDYKRHFFVMLEYPGTLLTIDHFKDGFSFLIVSVFCPFYRNDGLILMTDENGKKNRQNQKRGN